MLFSSSPTLLCCPVNPICGEVNEIEEEEEKEEGIKNDEWVPYVNVY
jgi:hypothetical protein